MVDICPCCGYDLSTDRPLKHGDYLWQPGDGLYFKGDRIDMPARMHNIAGSLLRARGNVMTAKILAERTGSDAVDDPRKMMSVYFTRMRHVWKGLGKPFPIVNVLGQGWRWHDGFRSGGASLASRDLGSLGPVTANAPE